MFIGDREGAGGLTGPGGKCGVTAGWGLSACHDPVSKMDANGIDGLGVRYRVGGQCACAKVIAWAHWAFFRQRDTCKTGIEPTGTAAVVAAGDVVAPDIGWQGEVAQPIRADPLWRQLERPDLSRTKMLNNFWAGVGGIAAIKNARRRQAPQRICVRQPPLRAFAARLV